MATRPGGIGVPVDGGAAPLAGGDEAASLVAGGGAAPVPGGDGFAPLVAVGGAGSLAAGAGAAAAIGVVPGAASLAAASVDGGAVRVNDSNRPILYAPNPAPAMTTRSRAPMLLLICAPFKASRLTSRSGQRFLRLSSQRPSPRRSRAWSRSSMAPRRVFRRHRQRCTPRRRPSPSSRTDPVRRWT